MAQRSRGMARLVAMALATLLVAGWFMTASPAAHATTSFVSTWNPANTSTGSSAAGSVTLPLANGTFDFYVDWGDGGAAEHITNASQATHVYTGYTSGTRTITLSNFVSFAGWSFFNGGDKVKITNISQWGDLRLGNNGQYFHGCSSLTITASDSPNFSTAYGAPATTDLSYMFRGATSLTGGISNWDTSSVTDMQNMFQGASAFNGDISGWDTSHVTDMQYMFVGATLFNQPIGGWNTATVTNMAGMFNSASAFNRSLATWSTSSVTAMDWMFYNASAFDQSVAAWDVTAVTTMNHMLTGVTISTANYDAILNAWAAQAVRSNVSFSAGNSTYSNAGSAARATLTGAPKSWTITDGGGTRGVSAAPTSVAFGNQDLTTTSPGSVVTFTSAGPGSLVVGAGATSVTGVGAADFAITSDTCSGHTLAASATCTVTVAFTPLSAGVSSASLALASNAPLSPTTVAMSGTGVAPVVGSTTGGAPAAATYTITLDPAGGTCASTVLTGEAGSWVYLPTPLQCAKAGHLLVGWSTPFAATTYAPGSGLNLTQPNALFAVWRSAAADESGQDEHATSATNNPVAAQRPLGVVRLVIWGARDGALRSGDVTALAGHGPVFSIVTNKPGAVRPRLVARTQELAQRFGGTYGGIVRADGWQSPRIVAAYLG